MSFRTWFRRWVRSFIHLLSFDTKRTLTDSEKKKERERKARAKRRGRHRPNKERRRRQSSLSARNYRLIRAMMRFVATTLAVLLVPLGLLDWGRKNAKARRASHGHEAKRQPPKKNAPPKKETPKAKKSTPKTSTPPKITATSKNAERTGVATQKKAEKTTVRPASEQLLAYSETRARACGEKERIGVEADKFVPRSIPKNANDQCVRRRMRSDGTETCDAEVLGTLSVGAYIELSFASDAFRGKDAVMLTYRGEKIGYIAKQDQLSFATCLKLGRETYGVITEIIKGERGVEYEYEAWFAGK